MVKRGMTSWSESAMQWETNLVCPDCNAGRLVSREGNPPGHRLRHDWKTYPKDYGHKGRPCPQETLNAASDCGLSPPPSAVDRYWTRTHVCSQSLASTAACDVVAAAAEDHPEEDQHDGDVQPHDNDEVHAAQEISHPGKDAVLYGG
jgi:hypothetical protein